MNPARLFLFAQLLFTIFLSGGLFFKNQSLKNTTIAGFTLLYALELLYFLYGTSAMVLVYPQFHGRFYFSIGLIYGPLLWLHFRAVIEGTFKMNWRIVWHLIPVLILNVFAFPIVTLSYEDRLLYFSDEANFFSTIIYFNIARTAHQLIYIIAIIALFLRSKHQLSIHQKVYLGGIAIIYLLAVVLISFLIAFANSWRDFSWYYTLSNSIIFLIAYVLYRNPDFFKRWKQKYEQSNLNVNAQKRIQKKIERIFREKQLYLDNQLSIQKLAKAIGEKPPHLSQTFTSLFQSNFNDYINQFRIEYAKELLMDSAYAHYKIEAIAQAAGFNNKVTFYKAFSKFTDTTPSKFRKKRKE